MKIGNLQLKNNLLLAPMAGISDAPFRSVALDFGCALAFTEMVSANGLVRRNSKTFQYLQRFPGEFPFAVQIFGSDPAVMAEAACAAVGEGASLVDVNLGCPVKKIRRTGAGAALMREPGKAGLIFKKMRESVKVPLTVKMRSGWKADLNAPHLAALAEENGFDAVIVHPRTVEQGFTGKADWRVIREVKQTVRIPVIGNGDIQSAVDAADMVRETGCDGIMIGRGGMGRPWLFAEIETYLKTGILLDQPGPAEKLNVIERHLGKFAGWREDAALRIVKKNLAWYTKGLKGSSAFRIQIAGCEKISDLLGKCRQYLALQSHS